MNATDRMIDDINIVGGRDNKYVDLDAMIIYSLDSFELGEAEKITAKVLINDGWYGSFLDLVDTARRL
jgi:hypothetical protein